MTSQTSTFRALRASGMQSAISLFENAADSSSRYWQQALATRATPLDAMSDLFDWSIATLSRQRPTWSTGHEIAGDWPLARLRDFGRRCGGSAVPVLLLPPQAGHDSCIVDYAPGQSQVGTALDAGLRVYSMDWKGATESTKDATIEDYIAVVSAAVERAGGRVHLVGDCQGGWLAVIYAALHPGSVESLTIAGAPVDFHAGDPLIEQWMRVMSPRGELSIHRAIVAMHGGVLPGRFLLSGFKAMQPEGGLSRNLALLAGVRDAEQVTRHQRFENWFEHTQPIPGAFYLWIVRQLFQRNKLVAGTLLVGGERVDLARITMPLYLLAGAADHITPPPQVFALADHAGTPPADVVRQTAPGGHLGLFMGHRALRTVWTSVFSSLAKAEEQVQLDA